MVVIKHTNSLKKSEKYRWCRYDVTGGCKKIFGFSGEWKQRRIDRCRTGRSGNGRYNMEVLQEDRIMYRAGNVQNPYGRWFTSEDIMLCKLI